MNRDKEQNRKLSEAEKIRSEHFEKIKKELLEQGYKSTDLTIGLVCANIMAFVLTLPIILCFAIGFIWYNEADSVRFVQMQGFQYILYLLIFLIIFFGLIFAHEFIHGVTWSIFAKKHWRSISFGFIAEYMTPYCTCDEALMKSQYILGALMPTFVLGIIPAIIAIVVGSAMMFSMGAVMILSGGGDLAIVMKLLMFRPKSKDTLYIDHPYRAGLVAFER